MKLAEAEAEAPAAEGTEGKAPASTATKMAGCVTQLEKMKKDQPERYEMHHEVRRRVEGFVLARHLRLGVHGRRRVSLEE